MNDVIFELICDHEYLHIEFVQVNWHDKSLIHCRVEGWKKIQTSFPFSAWMVV